MRFSYARTRNRVVGGVLLSLAAVAAPLIAPTAAQAAEPTVTTLAGPSVAAMYSSGLTFDPGIHAEPDAPRLVIADTGLDRVLFYKTDGTKLPGTFGTHGAGDGEFDSPRDAAVDGAGNIYIADAGNNRIQKFTKTGGWLWTVGGIGTCNTCLNTPIGIDWDAANGVVLVSSTGQSLIKAFNPDGGFAWKSPTGATLDVGAPRDATRGPDGRIWVADYKHHQIKAFNVTAAGVWTTNPAVVLGDGSVAGHGVNQLNFPYNVEFSPNGNTAYVADTGNARIARYDISGATPQWLAPYGEHCPQSPDPCLDPPGDRGYFDDLRRVAVDTSGMVYGDDFWGNGIQVWDPSTNTNTSAIEGDGAPAPGFAQAFGVAVGSDGMTYVVDRLNQRLQRFGPTGTFLNTRGSRGTAPAHFSWPEAVAVGGDGKVWMADTRNDRLQRFNADLSGAPAMFGSPGSTPGKFNYPEGLAVAPSGKVWIADTRNDRLQVLDPAAFSAANPAAAFTTIGALGSAAGQFNRPQGVAVGAAAVFVADTGNNRIQKLDLNGNPLKEFTGVAAPEGVALADDGTVWVADTANNRVLHLSAELVNLNDGFGSAGTGPLQFDLPHSLAVRGSKVFVADTFHNRVQVVETAGGPGPGTFNPQYSTSISNPGGVAPLYPAGGVTVGTNRFLADSGGSRIVKIDANGNQTVVNDTAGWNDPRDIEADPNGQDLWVVDTSKNRIVQLSTTGATGNIFTGSPALKQPYGAAVDATSIYVADTYGMRVVGLNKSNGAQNWAVTTCMGKALKRPRDVAKAADGNLYVADTDNNRIVVLSTAGACLGSFGTIGAGGTTGAAAQFRSPRSVTGDGGNGLWVADALNSRVLHVTTNGTVIAKTSGGFGEGPGQYRSAHCVFMDSASVLNVCDTFNYRVQRYTVNGNGVPTLTTALGGTKPTVGGFNGVFTPAYDASGNLYVPDWFNHRIETFPSGGGAPSAFGGYGTPGGSFIFPRAVTVANGQLVVTNSENNRLDLFSLAGVFAKSIKPKTGTAMSRPHQTAVASDGTYWIADTNMNRVLHLGTDGTVLAGLSGGPALKLPRGIAIDGSGNIFVANSGSNTVEKYGPSGAWVKTMATAGTGPTNVKAPYGLLVSTVGDGISKLFITDSVNNRIVVLAAADGAAVTTFGQGQLNTPKGIALDPTTGKLAVGDFANNRVAIFTTG